MKRHHQGTKPREVPFRMDMTLVYPRHFKSQPQLAYFEGEITMNLC